MGEILTVEFRSSMVLTSWSFVGVWEVWDLECLGSDEWVWQQLGLGVQLMENMFWE